MNRKKSKNPDSPPLISTSLNSYVYSLGPTYIFKQDGVYQLMVFSMDNQPLALLSYTSLKEAQLFFLKQYDHLKITGENKPEWSSFYTPDKKWFEERLNKFTTVLQSGVQVSC